MSVVTVHAPFEFLWKSGLKSGLKGSKVCLDSSDVRSGLPRPGFVVGRPPAPAAAHGDHVPATGIAKPEITHVSRKRDHCAPRVGDVRWPLYDLLAAASAHA